MFLLNAYEMIVSYHVAFIFLAKVAKGFLTLILIFDVLVLKLASP